MLDVSGDRITAMELVDWLEQNVNPEDQLVVMVAEGEAALMAWYGNGPASRALDVPVFTTVPDLYTRTDAPAVDYLGENVTGAVDFHGENVTSSGTE